MTKYTTIIIFGLIGMIGFNCFLLNMYVAWIAVTTISIIGLIWTYVKLIRS